MEDLKENINPASLNGVIGRKWYFIIGAALGTIVVILTWFLAPNIMAGIGEAAKNNDTVNVYSIFNSGLIPDSQMYSFLFLVLAGIFFGFVNNTKRLRDITGSKKQSIIYAICLLLLALSLYFFNINSFMYMLVYSINMLTGLILIFKEGKYIKQKVTQIDAIKRSEMVDTKKSVSFWRRIFAHFIDSIIILNIVLYLILFMGATLWYKAGAFGILVSLIISFIYYSIMNSKISNGQTLGKKALGIKVVDAEGDFLSLDKSALRSLIYTLCGSVGICFYYAASTVMPDYLTMQPDFIYTMTILAILTIALYGTFLFNIKTRQTFHDFASGSYVVLKTNYSKLYNPKSNPAPAIIVSIAAFILCWSVSSSITGHIKLLPLNPDFTKQISSDLKINALQTEFNPDNGMLIITVRTPNIEDKMLAEKIYTYISENFIQIDKVISTKIILQNSYIVGAIGEVKRHTYTVK